MKKLKMLCLLPSICLFSCSKWSPVGVYEFRLGKTDGAHFGLSLELKDDAYEKREGTKQFSLSADLGSDFSPEAILDEYAEEYPLLELVIPELKSLIPEDNTLNGYYSLTDISNKTYGTRVKIGSDFIEEMLIKLYPDIEDFDEFSDLTAPEMVEMLLCAYVNEKQFTFQIPVSMEDVRQQLVWYGYLIDFHGDKLITQLDKDKMPGPKGEERFGVHPAVVKDEKESIISSEADKMNEIFEFEFSHTYLYQKDEFGIREPVGSFITRTTQSGQRALYFAPFDSNMSLASVKGDVLVKDTLFEEYKEIEFGVSIDNGVSVDYNGKTGNEEGFIDQHGVEIIYSQFLQKPFVFRDFHDVNVGLTKV